MQLSGGPRGSRSRAKRSDVVLRLGSKGRAVGELLVLVGGAYLGILISVVTVSALAQYLGVAELGRFAIVGAVYFFAATLVEFGYTNLVISDRPLARGQGAATRRAYLRFRAGLALGLLPVAVATYASGWEGAAIALVAGALSALDDSWVLYSVGAFRVAVVGDLCVRVVLLVLVLVFVRLEPSASMAMICYATAAVARFSYFRWAASRELRRHVESEDPSAVTIAVRDAIPLLLTRVIQFGGNQFAPVIFASMAPLHAIGLFAAADRVLRSTQGGINTFASFAVPRLALAASEERLRPVLARLALLGLAFGSAMGLCLYILSGEIVMLLFGDGYAEAIGALRLYTAVLPLAALSNLLLAAVIPILRATRVAVASSVTGFGCFGVSVVILGPTLTAPEMVACAVAAEAGMLACCAVAVMLRIQDRFQRVTP